MFGHTIFWGPQFLAGLTSILVAFYVWQRRSTPGAKTLLVLMTATAEWAFLSALHKASPDLSTKILIAKMQYVGIVTVPPALLALVLQYTGRERWLTGRNLILLAILPVITLALAWTNEFHKLIWKRIWIDISGSIPIGVYDYGPCFWIWTFFYYLAVLLSTIWLIQAFISSPRFYRMQILIMLIGIAAPWVANGLYLLDISPWPRIDLTPVAFTVTGLALGCGMFWVRILDIVPVAHATVLKSIPDGVIVLDDNKRVVNMNPAAQKILCLPNSGIIGQLALQIFANQPTLIEYLKDVTAVRSEITLGEGDTQHYYDLYISPFKNRQGGLMGRLITLRDFTQRKRAEEALRKAHDELEMRVDERTAELAQTNERLKQEIKERKRTEEKYRLLIENATDAIFIAQDEVSKFANPKAEEMTGYSAEELAEIPFLNLIHPEDRDMVLEKHLKRLKSEKLSSIYSFRILNRSGEELSVELNTALITWEERPATLNFLRDITAQKRLEAQLQQAQKMEAMGTLAGGIAHDFNNLLMAIQGRTSIMLMNKDSSHPDIGHLTGIEDNIESAADLTRQLLGFARGGKYEVKPTDINELIKPIFTTYNS